MQNTDLTKKSNTIRHENLLSPVKMTKESLTFEYIKIERNKFHHNKPPIFFNDADNEKVLINI